jgi:allophanate hydrolase
VTIPVLPPDPQAAATEAARRADAADRRIWITRAGPDAVADQVAGATGPLAGRLVAVKDNIDVAGMPTTAGCRAFAATPDTDADAVAAIRRAGAVIVGKTTMDMFATGLTGTRGPDGPLACALAPSIISGGSSSGSALAVAHGLAHIGLGTDTAGSGRVPAALNGIVGLKPTRGLVSTAGVVAACRSLDCVSIFTRTVDEALQALGHCVTQTTPEGGHAAIRAVGAPRIGVPAPSMLPDMSEEARSLHLSAVERCAAAGMTIVEVDVTPLLTAGRLLYEGPWVSERTAAVGDFVAAHPNDVDPVVREVIMSGRDRSAVDAYLGAYRLDELIAESQIIWDSVDVVLLPTVDVAPTVEEVRRDPHGVQARLGVYTNFVNLMDLCAVSVPAGRWASGAGFGVQFIAPAYADATIGAIASRFERRGDTATVRVCVVGAHLRGQPLNWQLTDRGARFVEQTLTTSRYALYALADTTPAKPGLVRVDDAGRPIEVEVWELPADAFGSFVAEVPQPLGIGTVELADGSMIAGFICEPIGLTGATAITHFGGWRAYLAAGA